jgi:hypothetical protein
VPKDEIDRLVHDAQFDCLRARHDAVDAASAKIALDLDVMVKKLGYVAILTVYPTFAALVQESNELRDKIVFSRANRENRESIYQVLESVDLPGLVKKYRALMASEPIMRKIASKARWASLFNYVMGIGGVLFGIGSWLFSSGIPSRLRSLLP